MRFRSIIIVTLAALSACTPAHPRALRPADVLPAKHVEAFVSGLTPQNAAQFTPWVGEAGLAPLADAMPSDFAVVRLPDNRRAWIRFLPISDPQARFPYRIASSDPAAEALLGTGADVLSSTDAFVTASALHTNGAWALRNAASDWQAIRFSTGATRIVIPADLPVSDPPRLMTSPLAATALVLHAGSSDIVGALKPLVAEDDILAADAILRTAFAELAGNAGTIRGDILPLLQSPFSLFAGPAPHSADMPFVLAGSSPDAQRAIDHLHELFRNRTLLISEQQRTFDGRFPSRNIRIDPAAIADTEEDDNGWHIRTTIRPDDEDTLVTARKDTRFILGTDSDAVRRAIGAEWVTQETSGPLTPAIIGWMDRPLLPLGLRALTAPLSEAAGSDGTLKWIMERGDGVLALTIYSQ